MSTALITQAREELELTTYTTLNRLIKEETDPIRLEKLLTLALRVKAPRAFESGARENPKPGRSQSESPTTRPGEDASSNTNSTVAPDSNQSPQPGAPNAEPSTAYGDRSPRPSPPSPLYTHMTDDEFLKLSREIGYTEAHRRRLIRAHLVREQQRELADESA